MAGTIATSIDIARARQAESQESEQPMIDKQIEAAQQAIRSEQVQFDQQKHVFSNRKEVRQEILAMAAEPNKPGLDEKIMLISSEVQEIKRKGRNTDQKYKYLKIEDVVNAIRPLLNKYRLQLTGSIRSMQTVPDPKGITFQIEMNWSIYDMDSGCTHTWTIPGSGWDYHDKGLYKAITGSRKYAHIVIFNLPVGDEPEAQQAPDRESSKAAQRNVVQKKLIEAAGKGNQTAIDALSQVEPEKKVLIGRPDEYHAHYIKVSGFLAVPAIDQFLLDTAAKRFQTKTPPITVYWRLGADYEKGLIALCQKLGLEVEG